MRWPTLLGEPAKPFSRLYYDNRLKVYRLALGLTGNVDDAEEITQEVFLRAFRSYAAFRRESDFFTWIYRITLNSARDYLKQRTKLPLVVAIEDLGYSLKQIIDPDPANDPETVLLANELQFRYLYCFAECLTSCQRTVFCLVITLGLAYKTTAEILGCSIGSVKMLMHRGKNRVAGCLEDRCRLIKESNSCKLSSVSPLGPGARLGIEKRLGPSPTSLTLQIKEELAQLETLRTIYQNLYQQTAEEVLAQRIRQGLENKEWKIFL